MLIGVELICFEQGMHLTSRAVPVDKSGLTLVKDMMCHGRGNIYCPLSAVKLVCATFRFPLCIS